MPPETRYLDLTLQRGLSIAESSDPLSFVLQRELADRINGLASEHSIFQEWCRRADALYYTPMVHELLGADLWMNDPSATTPGRSHISVNTPAVYVDVPAALQAVQPIENMLATKDTLEARHAANAMERIYKAWKAEENFELKFHKATTVKGLYGRTAGFVYWDKVEGRPCIEVIQNPRNLYLGYKNDDYESLEWAAYVTRQDPKSLMEKYSIEFEMRVTSEGVVPWAVAGRIADQPRPQLNFGPARVEVWDYWYRRPGKMGKFGSPTKMDTWNVVVCGNEVVGEYKYTEYEGEIPFRPLFNTFIPGTPTGRPELYDIEQLIREKMTRITAGAQMIAGATSGDYWQLVGADAPSRVPAAAKPRRNEVAAPGAGNRIEAITPFIAQFQLEQYLGRIDREMAAVSGLNDLLLGLAPLQSLSSSKAINALIANYETRIAMRRLLLYTWRRDMWELAVLVWARKDKDVKAVVTAGGGTLDIIDPSLSPRDEAETAVKAANLVGAKLWSQARGMDAVGVDDPEQEQQLIREDSTDATLWPERVQTMAQLLGILQNLGLPTPQGAQAQAGQQLSRGQSDLRTALGAGTPQGDTGSQGPELQGQTPPGALVQGATPPSGQPFAAAQPGGAGPADLQTLTQKGQTTGRILTSTKIPQGRR